MPRLQGRLAVMVEVLAMPHLFTVQDGVSTSCSVSRHPLVFLSALSAVDAFVLRAVCAVHSEVHLVRLVDQADPGRPGRWGRVRAHPWQSLAGGARDLVQAPGRRRLERRLERAFFGAGGVPDPAALGVRAVTEVPRWQVRHPPLCDFIRNLAPARMIVCGAPWLPARLYATARYGAFNVHWGIAPEYRGAHSIFFALAEGRTDRIGVTIHQLTPHIDEGGIVAQGTVDVTAIDDEETLWVKCAAEAAALAASLAALPAGVALATRAQGPSGHTYRYVDRTVRREVAHTLRSRLLRRRPAPASAFHQPARPAVGDGPRLVTGEPHVARGAQSG